jgi:hypothetical protein
MITRALVILPEPAEWVLDGTKTEEYRSRGCNIRETVGIIKAGTKTIVATADIVDCEDIWDGYAWIFKNVQALKNPVSYEHPSGAQIWVKLAPEVQKKVARAKKTPVPKRKPVNNLPGRDK